VKVGWAVLAIDAQAFHGQPFDGQEKTLHETLRACCTSGLDFIVTFDDKARLVKLGVLW